MMCLHYSVEVMCVYQNIMTTHVNKLSRNNDKLNILMLYMLHNMYLNFSLQKMLILKINVGSVHVFTRTNI